MGCTHPPYTSNDSLRRVEYNCCRHSWTLLYRLTPENEQWYIKAMYCKKEKAMHFLKTGEVK